LFLVAAVGLGLLFVSRKNSTPAPTPDWTQTMPAADQSANSMYGGAEHLFQQSIAPAAAYQAPPQIQPQSLALDDPRRPAGWTDEQWMYYGPGGPGEGQL